MKRTAINAQVFLASTATLAIAATCALAALTILFALILAHQPWLIRFAAIGLSLLVLAHGWLTLRLLWSGTESSDIGRLAIAVFGIFLVEVRHEHAVVELVGNEVVVVVVVTSVAEAVEVVVQLERVGDERTVVRDIRLAVVIVVAVAHVAEGIRVRVELVRVRIAGTVVAGVAVPVLVSVFLSRIG